MFRPNRDVRFSADKSPYKTRIYAGLERGGYVQFSADGLAAGCGYWMVEPDQLDRYRRAVADDRSGGGAGRDRRPDRGDGIEITAHETLKTAPRGYPKDHPRIELLRHKGLVTWKEWPAGAWLGHPDGQGPGGRLPPDVGAAAGLARRPGRAPAARHRSP